MLDFAQIKQGKFRINTEKFDIVKAVNDVMIIEQRKASDKNTKLHATFLNIGKDASKVC